MFLNSLNLFLRHSIYGTLHIRTICIRIELSSEILCINSVKQIIYENYNFQILSSVFAFANFRIPLASICRVIYR